MSKLSFNNLVTKLDIEYTLYVNTGSPHASINKPLNGSRFIDS